jgi:hypothetical protein
MTRIFADVSPVYLLISASIRIVTKRQRQFGGQGRRGHRLPGAGWAGEQQPAVTA